ncbi:MAG: RNA methyltransferase [Bacteroidales bacterium]|nr:RNA methyltransferase [Bacteroidales bacterium]
MHIQEITSAQNPKLKEVVQLLEKSKERRARGLFVVEGLREVAACLKNGYNVKSLFFNSSILSSRQVEELFGYPADYSDVAGETGRSEALEQLQIFSLSSQAYSKIAYRENTEGVVAVVQQKKFELDDVVFGKRWNNPLVLVVESVEKPGNLGALLRTADACGVDAVLVCDPLTDLYNPNLIRSSLGGIFTNQVVACSNEEALEWLQKNGVTIFTAQLQDSEWYYDTDMIQPTAIVMGTESTGLTDFWRNEAKARIKIPMLGELDSLNVSVSAAVLCYEAVRQRAVALR